MNDSARKKTISTTAFIVVLVIFIGIAVLYFYNILNWGNYPDFGFGFRSATGIRIVGLVSDHGKKAGLEIGDHLIEVNAKSFANIEEFRSHMRRKLGEENTYLIERQGRRFFVTIENVRSGHKRSLSVSGLPFLMGLGYVLIGTLVFLMKPHRRSSWIFFLSTSTFGLWQFFIYKISLMTPLWLESVVIFAYTFTPAVIIHLALCFPKERSILTKMPYAQFFPYIISTFLFIGIRLSTSQDIMDAPKFWLILAVAYIALGISFFLGSCVQLRLTSTSEIVKLRSKMILLGFAITASIPLLDYVINAIFNVFIVPGFNYYLPFFIFFPAFVGYSIVKHDLFDIDAIIKRTYGYVLTTGAIAGIYGLFVLISNLAFGSFEFTRSPLFSLIFILAIVFLFNPIHNRVQKFIDRVFYRLEYDYQETVKKISESMRTLLGLNEIGQSIMDTAMETMFIDSGYVMLQKKKGDSYRCLIQSGKKDLAFTRKPTAGADNDDDSGAPVLLATDPGPTPTEGQVPEYIPGSPEIVLASDEPFFRLLSDYQKEITTYDIQENPFFKDQRESCQHIFDQMDATLIVPLIHEKNLIGILSLGRKKSGKFYRREDINLLNILANQGAIAIENALMLEEVIEKERMEEELNIARDLQVSMLPVECPQIEGFEIAAFSESAREVGGDFYDFIEIGADKMGVVIGDVTGKSVSGALVMSASRSIFRMLGDEKLNVSESMIRANRRTIQDIKSGMFVALLYAVCEPETRSLSICSAGQTQPVFRSASSGEATLAETKGDSFPLGILEEANYEETRLQLEPGDSVVLYTDGVVEAMNDNGELFSFDRLIEVVKESESRSAQSLLEEIKSQVNKFAGSAPQHDDITIIVIQATQNSKYG